MAWFPKGRILASGSEDRTIRLWNPDSGVQIRILQGHTGAILSLSFSVDGRLLASKSMDGTVRLWRTDNWEVVAVLKEYYGQYAIYRPAFHPTEATTLATFGDESRAIRIWDLDVETLLGKRLDTSTVRYVNAKVVLVGDSGVGKTALCQVLTGGRFAPTESTHARKVWDFDSREVEPDDRPKEKRETLLWDLAGQPGYRPIHQWHLSEAALALVVFDSHSESEPFAGVRYWVRALRLAERAQRDAALHMKKFLVAARIDRGGKSVSRKRIDALLQELGFDDYFETSAKEVQNIKSLADTMRSGIRWDMLPTVTSSELFQRIQTFLVEEKNDGRQLSTFDDLYRAFLMKPETIQSETQDLRAQFDACVRLVQSQGLIRRLSFGNLVLLQPELLDAYAAALVNAVRNEPDGLGDILEDKVRACDFPMPEDERLPDREQEKLLLAAMVEDLLRYEIALQELSEDGQYLVFPAQSTRENPDLPDPEGKAVVFGFEGSVQNIYAALAVRLSHSGVFKKKDLWKDEMTFAASAGGTCGIILRDSGEGRGELTLFFDKAVGEETRFYFEGYVNRYLQGHAESISQRHIFVCSGCGFEVTDQLVKLRSERGFNWLDCPACHKRVSLLDREERLSESRLSVVQLMERAADEELERAIATSVMQGKITTGDFDVFLCHNGKDKPEVKKIGEKLKEHGILPWLDEWDLPPFVRWQDELQKVIPQMKAVAVFIGPSGVGPWEDIEMNASLVEFASRKIRIGLVLLPGCAEQPEVPLFMRSFNWVDFRLQAPDPMEQLIWGITGERKPIAKYKPVLAT